MPECVAYAPFTACSYGGACNTTTGRCACDDSYLSRGDFFPWEGEDCVVPVVVIRVIYVVALVTAVYNLLRRGDGLSRVWRKMKARNRHAPVSGLAKVLRLHVLGLVLCISQLAICIMYLALPEQNIGKDVAKTFGHALTGTLCFFCIFESCVFLAESIARLSSSLRAGVPRMRWYIRVTKPPYMALVVVVCVVAPFGSIIFGPSKAWMFLHLAGMQGIFAYLSGLVYVTATRFSKLLEEESITSAATDPSFARRAYQLRAKVNFVRRSGLMLNLSYQVIHSLVLVWPWARALVPLEAALLLSGAVTTETILFKLVDTRASKPYGGRSSRVVADSHGTKVNSSQYRHSSFKRAAEVTSTSAAESGEDPCTSTPSQAPSNQDQDGTGSS